MPDTLGVVTRTATFKVQAVTNWINGHRHDGSGNPGTPAIFGMNFDSIPLLHLHSGFWWAMGGMLVIASTLSLVFWRKRYISRTAH